uniref:V-SNARE coiled-coil homology domain-containing protein n=1 Tax=Haptolina ericina TaxID=156174 RepID=A0A7S3F7G4_9EUKA|mmetsp:Transcript_54933/g.122866  ORF Transcript_54933/g.122866 Transcript_54933/m.122866 type:complete len:258 (+) Transcript_54933:25-798(+)
MTILYSLVSRGTCVLAEFTTTSGNFTTVTRSILAKLPPQDTRMSYVYDDHTFHYIVDGGLVYLCMAEGALGRRIPFAFLEDIKNRWIDTYGDRGITALAYGMNEDFSRVLQKQMDAFSRERDPNMDRVGRVQGEIEEVRQVMVENIDRVLERGEKIELLVDKAENLNQQAFKFRKQSTALKRAMWMKNLKLYALVAFILGVIVLIISMFICGFDFHKCSSSHAEPPSAPPLASPPPPPPPLRPPLNSTLALGRKLGS